MLLVWKRAKVYNNGRGIYKRRSEKGKSLDELADKALQQIEDKKYEQELLDAGYEKTRIKKFAFVFEGKDLLIKESAFWADERVRKLAGSVYFICWCKGIVL